MPRSENPKNSPENKGRGTGESPFSSFADLFTTVERGSILKEGKAEIGPPPVPRPFFDPGIAPPSDYSRLSKGKDTAPFDRTMIGPNEQPWHTLSRDQVRYRASQLPARFLTKAERQAAGRDPGLIWDEGSRSYCPVSGTTPPPILASSGDAGGWGRKVSEHPPSRPAAARISNANADFVSSRARSWKWGE